MQDVQPNLIARDDTFFGVCQGLGEDLGINPLFLRLPFIPALFFYPVETLGVYAAAGVVVLATRLVFPAPRLSVQAQDEGCEAVVEQREESVGDSGQLLRAAA